MIIIIMIMTKITRMIMIIIIIIIMIIVIIIRTMKFTNVIGYHKPQFRPHRVSVRSMLVNELSY